MTPKQTAESYNQIASHWAGEKSIGKIALRSMKEPFGLLRKPIVQ